MAGWQEHLNPVSALSGRRIICGPDLWLYYHGFDLSGRKAEIRAFYEAPEEHMATLRAYGARYILLGPGERRSMQVDEDALERLFPLIYEDPAGTYRIYEVPPG